MQKAFLKHKKLTIPAQQKEYNQAWGRFWAIGAELGRLWKTRKNWPEVLKEERNW